MRNDQSPAPGGPALGTRPVGGAYYRMFDQQLVFRVWIEPGCIVCEACQTTCPEVFDVQETTCVIRPEALAAEFLRPRTQSVMDAAEECPVEVIKFEAAEAQAADVPAVHE